MSYKNQPTPFGSLLWTDNNIYWYTCGSWRLGDHPFGIPSIIAYAPAGQKFPIQKNQKTIDINNKTFIKVSNQPLSVYKDVYLSKVKDMINGPQFGRLVFLSSDRVIKITKPGGFVTPFVQNISPEGQILKELCGLLHVSLKDVGIWGSSLIFKQPVRRHEIDVVIYGRENCEEAFRLLAETSLCSEDLILDPEEGVCTQFSYKGINFDLFYDLGDKEPHLLDGAKIKISGILKNEFMTITDTTEGLYYPSIYVTNTGLRLISFRPAHSRRFFKTGQKLLFKSVSQIEIIQASGKRETSYGVLDYEKAEFIS